MVSLVAISVVVIIVAVIVVLAFVDDGKDDRVDDADAITRTMSLDRWLDRWRRNEVLDLRSSALRMKESRLDATDERTDQWTDRRTAEPSPNFRRRFSTKYNQTHTDTE